MISPDLSNEEAAQFRKILQGTGLDEADWDVSVDGEEVIVRRISTGIIRRYQRNRKTQ